MILFSFSKNMILGPWATNKQASKTEQPNQRLSIYFCFLNTVAFLKS